jgi:hypothetical protein
MGEVIRSGDIEGDFNCCPNAEPFPFKCSDCDHIMTYCLECNDLFPNLHDLKEMATEVNSLDRMRPAFACPRCGHSFEYRFLKNAAYRVTREEMIQHGLGHLLLKRS